MSSSPIPEDDERGPVLLGIARQTLEGRLLSGQEELPENEAWQRLSWLRSRGASFVTLEQTGALRGCIGSLDATLPLIEDVHRNTLAAAFDDPRFPPVVVQELNTLSIQVTLLSPRCHLEVSSEEEALTLLRPGTDGLVLSFRGRRATFLPGVWEAFASPAEFLAALKRKAGLPPDFWDPGVALERYSATSFSERRRP